MVSDGGGPENMSPLGQVGDDGRVKRVPSSISVLVSIFLGDGCAVPFGCAHHMSFESGRYERFFAAVFCINEPV